MFLKTPVQPPNATAVVNRLRAAIDLGVVRGGEALPREAVLARQLGVSAFVLRDALSSLRAEGLLTTRPGRGGGSFVTERSRPPLTASSEHLNPVSASAIRDLADWRATLLSGSASIACERVTRADLDHLRELALDVDDAARAPRALGTFVIQLAAAAQSTRLSIAAMTLQEEAGAMFSLPLRAAEYRANLSAALVLLVDSVGGRVPEAAAHAAG
ncbi:FadR/GntR family transcriptional regulator, partial [uncultured Amnibacterium sp.]|uniref:FadR/GntR family transcriptional regulator n=1 Tax=uncultured Amnibacterium sp. TaxID=1631851 RepID=UPI0035CC8347